MTAADILRSWDTLQGTPMVPVHRNTLRAVADLMERCVQPMWQVSRQGNEIMVGGVKFSGNRCMMCGSFGPEGTPVRHAAACPLAALERLIKGEPSGN